VFQSWLVLALSTAAVSSAVPTKLGKPVLPTVLDDRLPLTLVVEIDVAGVTNRHVRVPTVLSLAAEIWRPHLDLAAVLEPGAAAACGRTLTVKLTNRHRPAGAAPHALTPGWVEFVDGEPSSTIYVSPAVTDAWVAIELRNRSLLEMPPRGRAPMVERALAWTIAHEIGHYLLRSPVHASGGLMKARFTMGDLAAGLPGAARGVERHSLTVPAATC